MWTLGVHAKPNGRGRSWGVEAFGGESEHDSVEDHPRWVWFQSDEDSVVLNGSEQHHRDEWVPALWTLLSSAARAEDLELPSVMVGAACRGETEAHLVAPDLVRQRCLWAAVGAFGG